MPYSCGDTDYIVLTQPRANLSTVPLMAMVTTPDLGGFQIQLFTVQGFLPAETLKVDYVIHKVVVTTP